MRSWRQAGSGEGRVVLISGEPGIGKSRLTVALQDRLQEEPHIRLRYFCSPQHTNSAFYPVISQLERAARFERTDAPEAKFRKLSSLVGTANHDDARLLAELLSIPAGGASYDQLDLSSRRKKERTLAALLHQLDMLGSQRAVLVVYEDVHWIDPSTHGLLDMIVERVVHMPVLLIITFRPEFQPPWVRQVHINTLAITRLGHDEGAALVGSMTRNASLPGKTMAEIVERADGIPLFVEELTKVVMEAEARNKRGGATVSSTSHPVLNVPATLQASLLARLDYLGWTAKEIAQIGSAIGREFSYELLARVAEKTEEELRSALDRFNQAGLVFCRGIPPEATFLFKHALVRDAAYSTLLRGHRHRLHGRIVTVLERNFPEVVKAQPETLAHHCAEAGLTEQAIEYCLAASKHATARSNNAEATQHLNKALALLETLPPSAQRGTELRVKIQLGGWWWSV